MTTVLDAPAPEMGAGQPAMDLLERLYVLMRTIGTLGPTHPSSLQNAAAAAEALAACHPPLSFQFVREATFCNRSLLPLDLEAFQRAQVICKAMNNLHIQEVTIGQQLSSHGVLELGTLLARGMAGQSDILESTRLTGVDWRELPGAGWGTESRQIDPDLFAVTNLSLAVQDTEMMCDLVVPWDWVRGVSVVRRLERAAQADLHAANRALEFVPQPWTQGRQSVALALRVAAVLVELKAQPAVTRATAHAALIVGCSGLSALPVPFQQAATNALPRGLASAGKSALGAARHQIRVMSILHAIIRRPATQEAWAGPLGVVELCYALEVRRATNALANLTLGDLLASVLPEVGIRFDIAWFRALIATVGALPPGARVRLADGRLGIVLGPGAAGDPWRPQVLIGALVVEPAQAVDLVANAQNARAGRGASSWA